MPEEINGEIKLINHCVLTAGNLSSESISGFTVLEPRDLNAEFLKRIINRRDQPAFKGLEFTLYAPLFLKHRVDTLLNNCGFHLKVIFTSFVGIDYQAPGFLVRSRIRVVNVDDSPVMLKFLKHSLDEMQFVDIVAQVSDPQNAFAEILKRNPDLITMDIQMPGITGVDLVREILSEKFFPILMLSSLNLEEGSLVFDALNSGAFDYIQKPKFEEKEEFREELRSKILLGLEYQPLKKTPAKVARLKLGQTSHYDENLIWCFGASTGGTSALTEIFTSLPDQIPPTLIVQHIPPVFSRAFAESLNKICPFTVKEAEHGEILKKNHVYIAPGGMQMGVIQQLGKISIVLSDSAPINRFKPSVDFLFSEVARLPNLQVVAALLTGMGKDGAEGLLKLKKSSAFTIVQDEASSAVYGMPRHAFEIGAAMKVVSLQDMAHSFLEYSYSTLKGRGKCV